MGRGLNSVMGGGPKGKVALSRELEMRGIPGSLSGLAPPSAQGVILETRDPGDLGSSPTSGSLHGACFSLCLSLSVSLTNK